MKIIYKVGLLTSFLSLNMQAAENQCSQLTFEETKDKSHYQIYANGSNNLRTFKKSNEYFNPGQHSVTILKWGKEDWVNYSRTHKFKKTNRIEMLHTTKRALSWNQPKIFNLLINVEANKKYVLSELQKDQKFELTHMKDSMCMENDENIIGPDTVSVDKFTLPQKLQYRLDKLMAELKNNNENISVNFIPFTSVLYFGAIPNLNNKSTKLLAVTPNSQASLLGLRAGDKIVKLGKTELSSQQFNSNFILDYLKSLKINDAIEATIIRDENEITLKGVYTPEIIPEYSYSFSKEKINEQPIISSMNLDNKIALKLSKLLIEINQNAMNQGINRENVVISRSNQYDGKFGMTGNIEVHNTQSVFVVENVDDNSPASRVGLNIGDRIIQLNNKYLQKGIQGFAHDLSRIKNNDIYEFRIVRGDETKVLSRTLVRNLLPEYQFSINFGSKERALKLMAKYGEYQTWKKNKDRGRNSVSHTSNTKRMPSPLSN